MTLSKLRRGTTATMLALALGLGASGCSSDFTVSYLYATTSRQNPGLINAYKISNRNGALEQLADSPVPSGGRNPVAITLAPNSLFLYVVNRDDSTVVEFAIGTDGKLYAQHTYNTTGSFPTAAAVSADGKFLYVSYLYQFGFTTASPGPGGLSVFPIAADNTLGTPVNVNAGRNPVAIATSKTGSFVYVLNQDPATGANLLGFAANGNSLTPLAGVTINPGNVASTGFAVGTAATSLPSAIAEDSAGKNIYVTDFAANRIFGFTVTNGIPTAMASSYSTDVGPSGITIDPTGKLLYVTNYTAGTIGTYTVQTNGTLLGSAASSSSQAGAGATCITVEPRRGIYLYTTNFLDNSITGKQLDPATGALTSIQGTPFVASFQPTCAVIARAF